MSPLPAYNTSPETDRLIRSIVEHTHHKFGIEYFRAVVKHLAEGMQVKGAWVTEYLESEKRLKSLAFWFAGAYIEDYEYDVVNTPCEVVMTTKECLLVSDKVIDLFPLDPDLTKLNAVSYMGYPMWDENNRLLGHLAILHDAPLYPGKEQEALFYLFLQRANAEFLRIRAEQQIVEKKMRLSALVSHIHDAIVEMDEYGFITFVNPAALTLLGTAESDLLGTLVYSLFDDESSALVRRKLGSIRSSGDPVNDERSTDNLYCVGASGGTFPVEVSICHYEVREKLYITMVIHDLKELSRAERRIEIAEEGAPHFTVLSSGIIGQSKRLTRVLEEAVLVARSNSTVLLLGESGTGKEVIARHIHTASPRKDKPLIKVNCAAIPANLIESEFFGHEKGAFTGAIGRREGRFSLADGGTLFLDEVGELPLEMQPKLLRVLQEGEFESVGGQRTIRVNVRIIAATNRDLLQMVKEGTFREDLYYRLNVIPIALPPLRERDADILLLADMFVRKFSREAGKRTLTLSVSDTELLMSYHWPGNIRELEHVIERAVVLSTDSRLNLEKFIPRSGSVSPVATPAINPAQTDRIMTASEVQNIERDNIVRALNSCSWKIAGDLGAARALGLPPSTLTSKIKVLGITRPKK